MVLEPFKFHNPSPPAPSNPGPLRPHAMRLPLPSDNLNRSLGVKYSFGMEANRVSPALLELNSTSNDRKSISKRKPGGIYVA